MELKKAALTDLVDLKKVCSDAYALNFHNHWNEGGLEWYLQREFSSERLTVDLNDKNTVYYFIKHELKSVGFLKIKYNSGSDFQNNISAELEKIYVLPKHKGKGIGKTALKEIIKRCTADGIKNLFLAVIDTNLAAITFYEKLGFEYHSKTTLDIPYFKEELKGMHRMVKELI